MIRRVLEGGLGAIKDGSDDRSSESGGLPRRDDKVGEGEVGGDVPRVAMLIRIAAGPIVLSSVLRLEVQSGCRSCMCYDSLPPRLQRTRSRGSFI